ncbi:glutathione S-transferase [Mycena vulgaris]|nr:glutathione S-transferase [Mycena vulgaris]
MVLKLYGPSGTHGATGAVAMTLMEKEIPFQLVYIDMAAGAHKTAEYIAKQPYGQVPLIDDDGFVLYESRAICRYLSEKYAEQGTPLIPTEIKDKALFEQAASVEFANFEPHAKAVFGEGFHKRRLGLEVDQAVLAKLISDLSTKLDVYEIILGKQKYLAGDDFTLADLFHVSYGAILVLAECDLMTTKGPNIARWWNDVISRPSWVSLQDGIKSTVF